MSRLAISPTTVSPVVTRSAALTPRRATPLRQTTSSVSRRAVESLSRPGARRSMNSASFFASTRTPAGKFSTENVIFRACDAPRTSSLRKRPKAMMVLSADYLSLRRT